jgi:hypothetical protein
MKTVKKKNKLGKLSSLAKHIPKYFPIPSKQNNEKPKKKPHKIYPLFPNNSTRKAKGKPFVLWLRGK